MHKESCKVVCHKENFYRHVNGQWFATKKIPSDRSIYSSMTEMAIKIEDIQLKEINEFISNQKKIPNKVVAEYVKLYQMAIDTKNRDKLGFKEVKNDIKNFEKNFKSFSQIDDYQFEDFLNYAKPFNVNVGEDFKENDTFVLWLSEPKTILPNKDYYNDETSKNKLLKVYQKVALKLLTLIGKKEDVAKQMIKDAIAFDALIYPNVLSSTEKADYPKLYNPVEIKDLENVSKEFNLSKAIQNYVQKKLKTVVIDNPGFFKEHFNNIFNKKNIKGYKAKTIISLLFSVATYLTEESRKIIHEWNKTLSGTKKMKELNKFAYYLAKNSFGETIGLDYALRYFGPEAKQDVENMVNQMKQFYIERIEQNTWLSQQTKVNAIKKVNQMKVQVGYPTKINSVEKTLKIVEYNEGGSLYSNFKEFNKKWLLHDFKKINKKNDPELWEMTADLVNAYFHPLMNKIVFPAAILQSPLYSLTQSKSKNWGGIGTVIAHEITHSFDNNGAQFDADGKLNMWWTEEDFKEFNKRVQKVVELYDGYEVENNKVNGKLTVSENIADISGFDCALQLARKDKTFEPDEFFRNFATIWRTLITPELLKMLLTGDVHSPAEARANVNLMNCDYFQEFYKIKPKNKMYLAKEKRVKIW